MNETQIIDIICSNDPEFPWTKFRTLMLRPEIYEPQLEDGSITPDKLDIIAMARDDPRKFHWLVMNESRTLGFIAAFQKGAVWAEIHMAFRRGVGGRIKKESVLHVMKQLFSARFEKLSALIPASNRPARVLVRSCGGQLEGRLVGAIRQNGRPVDLILYGVTRDELVHRI